VSATVRFIPLGVLIAAAIALPAVAQERPIYFTGAHLIPMTGPPIEDGIILFHKGKIVGIGGKDEVVLPDDAEQIDVAGMYVLPGLIDTHSHIGGIGGADGSSPTQPDVRVFDSLNVRDSGFRRAWAGGMTTLNIMPGSGHLLSGQTVYVKLRPGARSIDDIMYRDADGNPLGGMKMANGTNSMRNAPFPGTRAKSAAIVRNMFIGAQEYGDKLRRAGDDAAKKPDRDLAKEALLEVLSGKRVVHHHTHRADDIMTVLRLKEEFGFRCVLHHVSEAWKIADQIAAANVPCSVILIDSPGGKLEAAELSLETCAILERAGVKVAIHTDDWINDSRLFLRMGAMAVRGGMSREGALKALTLHGAEMLDLQDRIGSLEPGKDADLCIVAGDPFGIGGKVMQTWVEGKLVFDRTREEDRLYAVGGYGAGNDTHPYMCCAPHQHEEGE
jgi:imidazolonepropionase-like amidohydrolase